MQVMETIKKVFSFKAKKFRVNRRPDDAAVIAEFVASMKQRRLKPNTIAGFARFHYRRPSGHMLTAHHGAK